MITEGFEKSALYLSIHLFRMGKIIDTIPLEKLQMIKEIVFFFRFLGMGNNHKIGSIDDITKVPIRNTKKVTTDKRVLESEMGCSRLPFLFLIRKLKSMGVKTNVIIKTEPIPMMATEAMDLMAGCFAKTNTPNPPRVVSADIKTEVLKCTSGVFPCL